MTFVIKVRAQPGSLIAADYECPVHGRFESVVPREANGDPPEVVPCPSTRMAIRRAKAVVATSAEGSVCMLASYWRIAAPAVHTQFVVSAHQGKPDAKPHVETMDTRPLVEGRSNEFRRNRKKLKEDRRHRRVKELLR